MAKKTIEKYGENDYKIKETKSVEVISTANIKVLEREIKTLETDIDELASRLAEKKELLQELKDIK